ncbi:hypothetical protein KCU78_g5290, partial [Aureobasidium melanogenum]
MDIDIIDSALDDVRFLFRDLSSEVETIRCWKYEEVHQIIDENPETVELVSFEGNTEPMYTATINRRLLTRLSPYFKSLLEGGFSESTEKNLPFESYPHQLHAIEERVSTGTIRFEGKWLTYDKVSLYLLADYYDLPALRREIMLKLASPYELERFDTRVSEWQVGSCLAELPATSPFYRWMVEHWAHCNSNRLGRKMRQNEDIPQELRDMVFDRPTKGFGGRPCKCCHNPCDFHEHENEEEWKRTCHLLNKKIRKPDPSTYRKAFEWP